MPKTLLAVDDSATMRKVLEITLNGEDFRVVTADGSKSALARLSEGPVAAVIDTSLDGDDGYALAKEIRSRDPRIAIVLLSSRHSPYDANRGRDAGADDSMDKPFDTQALIDKMKKAIVTREATKATAAAAPPPAVAPPAAAPPRAPGGPPGAPPRAAFPTQRTHTLSYEGVQAAAPPAPVTIARTAPSGSPVVQPSPPARAAAPIAAPVSPPVGPPAPVVTSDPAPRAPAAAAPSRVAEAAPTAAPANGQLAGKLADLGLTAHQVDAVLALSREVVERVVWEVVPQLAEALIKEEIARLTKSG